jgi:hypothetical protein
VFDDPDAAVQPGPVVVGAEVEVVYALDDA